jgi:cytochrome c-type biogenesis protein CcmH/NrfG
MILIAVGCCLAGGILFYLARHPAQPVPNTNSVAAPVAPETASQVTFVEPEPRDPGAVTTSGTRPSSGQISAASGAAAAFASAASPPFQQALATLVSSQATFDQKQAAWKQIKDSGKLDQLMTELEQRVSANPTSPEYPATLGQAYLQKAGTLNDIREQGILGMKADQSFDAALAIEPANWEAGFWKATAMSYWPPQLGKGAEVIERFVELVKVQESQQPQPQFAQTYTLLGEQYQKQGYADYAKQIWQRGAALFPGDSKLAEKLTQLQAQASAAGATAGGR